MGRRSLVYTSGDECEDSNIESDGEDTVLPPQATTSECVANNHYGRKWPRINVTMANLFHGVPDKGHIWVGVRARQSRTLFDSGRDAGIIEDKSRKRRSVKWHLRGCVSWVLVGGPRSRRERHWRRESGGMQPARRRDDDGNLDAGVNEGRKDGRKHLGLASVQNPIGYRVHEIHEGDR